MDYFFLLLIIYMSYIFISFLISGWKIISPSVIFSLSFTFMISLAYIFKNSLGFEVSLPTFQIFTTGGAIFLVVEFFVMLFYKGISKRTINGEQSNISPLIIDEYALNAFVVLMFLSTVFALLTLFINTAGGSIGQRMALYKNAMLYQSNSLRYRFIVNQLYKINIAIVYFIAYVAIYNAALSKIKIWKQKKHLLIIILFCMFSIFTMAARQPTIEIIIFMLIVYLSLMMRKSDKKKARRFIRRAIPLLIILVVAFYYTKTLIGRRKTERGILEYLAVYFSGGLYSFNLHVNEPARNVYWGQSSFAEVYNVLIKLGILTQEANMQYHSFDLYGNTVTMFGRWYEDFGKTGVYIMVALVSLFFAAIFYKYISRGFKTKPDYTIARLFYCKFLISLVWAGYDDRIRPLLSMTTIVTLILVIVLYNVLIKKKIKFRIR